MIVAIAISAAEAMSRIKFMVFLHLKVESRPSLKFMPRILEGLNPLRGLVERRKGIGWRQSSGWHIARCTLVQWPNCSRQRR
jgi:hypothetical protein